MSKMSYNDFTQTTSGQTWVNSDLASFPNFANHLDERFYYEIFLYDDETMIYKLLKNVLRMFNPKLKQLEILANLEFSIDDLGNVVTSSGDSKTTSSGTDGISYTGYNVDGDYQNTTSSGKNKTKSNSTVKSINKLKETINLVNSEMKQIYEEVDEELWMLFRQIW